MASKSRPVQSLPKPYKPSVHCRPCSSLAKRPNVVAKTPYVEWRMEAVGLVYKCPP